MSNILIVNLVMPYPENRNGNTVRVLPLSRELCKQHHCFLIAFEDSDIQLAGLLEEGIYEDVLLLPLPTRKSSALHHLFFRTGHLYSITHPAHFKKTTTTIKAYIEKNYIDLVLVHTLIASEFIQPLRNIPMIVDNVDCRSLSLTRKSDYSSINQSWIGKLIFWRNLARARYQESRLADYFTFVTTVSPVDRMILEEINPTDRKTQIIDIPNGVNQGLVSNEYNNKEIPKTIAFWGALDFPPNNSAVHYFYSEVFRPYLSGKGITWYIIGRNPDQAIVDMGLNHENIIVTGFIDDLYSLVSTIPIMINPMKMGGGLKNKVLEAFALKRLVISNAMGMEAFPAERNVHYVHAETATQFAEEILHYASHPDERIRIGEQARALVKSNYTWESVGQKFLDLIDAALSTG